MSDPLTSNIFSSMIVLPGIDPSSKVNQQDITFLQQAQLSNLTEVAEGKVALTNTSTDATREFGRWMIGDHGANGTVITSLADRLGVAVPTSLDAQHQAELADLSSRQGADFDQAYAASGVADHAQTIALFQQEIADGANPAVVSFAQQTLPLLQAHYQQAALLAGLQLAATAAPAQAMSAATELDSLSEQDAAFVKQAASINLTEIAEGQIASARSDNAAIDEYGRWMIADHGAMNLALQSIAGGEVSSASPQSLPPDNGASFDVTYLSDQVSGHAKALMVFIKEAANGQNAPLVDYAKSALPVLAQHLASAVELRFGFDLPSSLSPDDFKELSEIAAENVHITEGMRFAGQPVDHLLDKSLLIGCRDSS
jgi:putative membrane protein